MKNSVLVLLAAALLCCTVSCGSTESEQTVTDNTQDVQTTALTEPVAETADTTVYTCVLADGTSLYMGAAESKTLTALGDPGSVEEAPSCIHEGMDYIYTFNGFTLITSPDGHGNNVLYEFALNSDAVALENGLTIGSDKAAVESAFGTEYTEQFGMLKYALDGVDVTIILDGDSCVSSLVLTLQS